MIKKFEEFVLECYVRPVNEAFQSSKLREIIKQHGKPKYDFEKKMLYDLQDDEIVDVLDSRSEYWEKYSDERLDNDQATFMLELEDGAVIVISNLDILMSYNWKNVKRELKNVFNARHEKRHKGNLGKHGGDDIHDKHMKNVDKIERRRMAEGLQDYTQEIVDAVKKFMDNLDPEGDDINTEIEITLGGNEYSINVVYNYDSSEIHRRYGAEYYDIYYSLDGFDIYDDEGTCVTNDDVNITPETYHDLFKEYTIEDVEGYVYDEYEHYGVKRSDFI